MSALATKFAFVSLFAATAITGSQIKDGTITVADIGDSELAALGSVSSDTDKLPYFTAPGSAAVTTVTTLARSLLDDATAADMRSTLEVTSVSPYAADDWNSFSWEASPSNTMATDGWSTLGSVTDTADTVGGIACRKLTPANASGYGAVYKTIIPNSSPWEMRWRSYHPTSTASGGNPWYGWSIRGHTGGLARTLAAGFVAGTSPGWYYWNGTNLVTTGYLSSGLDGRWIDWTLRVTAGTHGTVQNYELWAGPLMLAYGNTSVQPWVAVAGTEGIIYIGKINGSSGTAPSYLASIKVRTGWNEAPPSYTFRSNAGALGP